MGNYKLTVGNVCFLLDKNNNILLLERYFEPMKGKFTGVGGKTNYDEDILSSCIREVKEETGLTAKNLKLKGIIKTIFEDAESAWILFLYTCNDFSGNMINCPEGDLAWVPLEIINQINLIGFIREIIYMVLNGNDVIEGTIWHNKDGEVLKRQLNAKSI